MTVKPDSKAAIKFLNQWSPAGPWVLTAIQVDRKSIDTKTFYPATLNQLEAYLKQYNGERNIYFHVNPPIRDLTKKAEREDIKSVDWLHVDIDPRAGHDLKAEREIALDSLTSKLPKGVPAPTAIIFSGGGFQAFWKLVTPIKVDGDLGLAEDAKRYNQQLELLFGADNCHNIDRIMRLPGSINIPDAKKIKKGRQPELATVVQFTKNEYPLTDFTPAVAVQLAGESGFGSTINSTVKISGNIERLVSVDELDQWGVPDRVKVIIVQGNHPDQPKENGDNSRSSWLFDVACNLVRAEVPDEVIFSILTDPEFGISESVLEQKTNAEKYAIRQIEKAKEWAIDPMLVKLNDQFAVIGNMGGKCRVVEETMDFGLKRTRLTKQSFEDFRNRFMHKTIVCGEDAQGNPKMISVGKWWLSNAKRRQYDNIIFAPGKEVNGAYNLWKGFACESKPGNCEAFIDHIYRNVCGGSEELTKYLIGWMARCVQQPDSPGEVAIVMKGGRGTGKSFFAKQFGRLFGRHFLQVSNSSHLVGNFNSHLRDVVVLFADEAFFAGDKRHASVLKTLITEETIPIEAKGVDIETAPNYVHLLMASNDTHVIPAGGDERRFLVLEVGNENQQDVNYFGNLAKMMDEGGLEALLHFLMTYDISGFQVRNVPKTDALREQKLLSLGVEEEWWYQKLIEGRILQEHGKWEAQVMKDALVNDYIENAKRFNVNRRGTATSLGRFLNKMVPGLCTKQIIADVDRYTPDGYSITEKKRCYHYMIPTIEDCRKQWEKFFGDEKWPVYTGEGQKELSVEIPF